MEEFFYILQKAKNKRINVEKDKENLENMPEMFKKVCRLCLTEASEQFQPPQPQSQLILSMMQIDFMTESPNFHNLICDECNGNLLLFYKFREKVAVNNETLTVLNTFIEQLKCPMKFEDLNSAAAGNVFKVPTTSYAASVDESFISELDSSVKEEKIDSVEQQEVNPEPVWCHDDGAVERVDQVESSSIYKCVICNQIFKDDKLMVRHMLKKHGEEQTVLEEHLEETLTDVDEDAEFLESVWDNGGDEIEMIDEEKLEQMQNSPISDSNTTTQGIQSSSKRRLNHRCLVCKRAFDGPKKLARHLKTHEPTYKGRRFQQDDKTSTTVLKHKKYNCPLCWMAVETPSKLKKHMEKHKDEMAKMATGAKFLCSVCECEFPSADFLNVHERQHDIFSRTFRRLETDKPKLPLLCELCGKNFMNRSSFILHLPQHTGEKPFKCELCDVRFTRKYHVKIHMRSHDNVKPFSCEICGMTFTKSGNMYRHLAVHSNERNYPCEYCGKKFKRKNDLPKHMICHTGERNFKCKTCNKTYTSRSGLVKHRKYHPDLDATTSRVVVFNQNQSDTPAFENTVDFDDATGKLTMIEK